MAWLDRLTHHITKPVTTSAGDALRPTRMALRMASRRVRPVKTGAPVDTDKGAVSMLIDGQVRISPISTSAGD
jgi:hypothetical protein